MKEVEYTKASEYCYHPELYDCEDSQSSESEVGDLLYGFVRITKPMICIETGTYHGMTSKRIGQALKENGIGILRTYEIDNNNSEVSKSNTIGLPVIVYNKSSLDADRDEYEKIDFIFLDSNAEYRLKEFEKFKGKFYKGTIIAIHDVAPQHGDFAKAAIELIKKNCDVNILFHNPRGLIVGVYNG